MADRIPFDIELLARALDILPYKYYIVDRDLNIAFWNKKGEEGPYGVKQEEAIGRPLVSVLMVHRPSVASPKPIDAMAAEFREVFEKGAVIRAEETSLLVNGYKRHYRVTKTPIRSESGEVSHAAVIIEDMTIQRRLESTLLAKERLFTLGHLAAGIAHQVNNPLSTLMVCLESLSKEVERGLIGDREISQRFERYLGISMKQVEKCKDVAMILMSAGRTETGERTETDVNRILEELISILKSSKGFLRTRVETRFQQGLPAAMTNETLLRQAIVSVLVNALESVEGREDALVTVSTSLRKGGDEAHLIIEIEDNGAGIAREHLGSVFTPFFTTKGNARAGLGLTVAHEIISWHNGGLDVESDAGKGCLVTIRLPLTRGRKDAGIRS
ncbi:MAG: ATP-binding protein [Thermodesulfobacteriota bacterium]|nr:MAG: ATP-binding protein [Thermodesulfobacteriota bacterium]